MQDLQPAPLYSLIYPWGIPIHSSAIQAASALTVTRKSIIMSPRCIVTADGVFAVHGISSSGILVPLSATSTVTSLLTVALPVRIIPATLEGPVADLLRVARLGLC